MASNKLIAEIIAVGDEVLSGRVVNTNASFLSKEMEKLGFPVQYQQVVRDGEKEIVNALRLAATRSNVIVFCGGLGPTKDDLTKEAVASAFKLNLVTDESVLAEIEDFFESRGMEMTENNKKQALVPEGCIVLHNVNGTAPGLILNRGKNAVVLLPGPPHEMQPLFLNEAAPRLAEMNDGVLRSASLMVTGISESALEEKAQELLYGDNPHSALYAGGGSIEIHISSLGTNEEEAQELLDNKVNAFTALLGDKIYAKERITVAESVVGQLIENGKTVSVAESCTGGMMAQQITAVAGSSACFEYGAATYADWSKHSFLDVDQALLDTYSAVSSVVAVEMARGIRAKGKADFGVGITGIAGPGVGNYLDKEVGEVYIAVCDKKRSVVKEFHFGDKRSRDNIRSLSCVNAFDMLRRFMNGLPVEDGAEYTRFQIADLKRKARPRTKAGIFARKMMAAILALGTLIGGSIFSANIVNAASDRDVYTELREEYQYQASDDPAAALEALKEKNGDTVGWLTGTEGDIDTVVVREREWNYYENHDFLLKKNIYGCARVLHETSEPEETDNLVITASKDGEGILFEALPKYVQQDYASKHRFFQFSTGNNMDTFEVFSVFYLDAAEGIDGYIYNTRFRKEVAFQQFVISTKMRSIYSTDLTLSYGDRFLTLVCPFDEMWEGCNLVVVAKRVTGNEAVRATTLSMNGSALYPNAWYETKGLECSVNITAESDKWLDWYRQGGKVGQALQEAEKQVDHTIRVTMNGEEIIDSPTEIIARIVTNQAPDIKNEETLKALAVAAATELKYKYSIGEKAPEVTGRAATDLVRGVVRGVLEETLTYGGQPSWTPVFHCSSGSTNNASEMVEGSFPYLVSVESEYDSLDKNSGYYEVTDFTADLFRSRVEALCGITLSEDIENWLEILNTTSVGTVTKVMIDGKLEMDGYEFFSEILALPSANVTVALNNRTFRFTIYGTGRELGMSIAGAKYYVSKSGWTYDEVLSHFYPGTSIENVPWDEYYAEALDAKKEKQ